MEGVPKKLRSHPGTPQNGGVSILARAEDGDDSARRRRRDGEHRRLAPGAGSAGRQRCWMSGSGMELLGAIQPEKLVGVNDFRREEAKGRGLSAT